MVNRKYLTMLQLFVNQFTTDLYIPLAAAIGRPESAKERRGGEGFVPLYLQDYIDTSNWYHAFKLYSEVQKANGQIEDNNYKCTLRL